MFGHAGNFTGRVFFGAVCLASCLSVSAPAAGASPPNFAPNASVGWYNYSRQFIAPPRGPGPVQQDPEHPYVSNDEFRVTGSSRPNSWPI
jgi:hypothetical protein